MARVGIREVATLAGVSVGTVSHYLNHPSRVSPEKSERIQRAIDKLGFVRNNAAWQLRLGRSTTIAYIVPDVSNPFFAAIAEGVEQRAAAHDLSVFIANSNRSRAREDAYLEMFQAQRVQGLLVASHEPIEDRLITLRQRGVPSVLVGQRGTFADQPSVSVDDVAGGRMAAAHLLELGRSRIAFVGGPLGIRQVADRLDGAGSVIGQSAEGTLEVINVAHRTIAEGRAVARLLAARRPQRRPDAVFAVNDLIALGLIQELVLGHGIRVPEDIAVIGYDDIEFAESSLIPLSSIRAPHEEFGHTAVDLLVDEMGEEPRDSPAQMVFQPVLVPRASTLAAAD
ncbi:LacI family DNA-binding transcriptional regulator [Streptomyces millisiae]|uniref:Substrate-binding domain-containing protein n=1 Tax=Streptomyces millisiae TaxID=3075542 RepID=A0ABU2LUU8_9ACTN|nr:substrate-binding domain-containing protein [Streptomyces sp. DSM 44918]MDT0321375.1 substrate-binding domain-containing protein [Streptomyces sp. DSM 44918]